MTVLVIGSGIAAVSAVAAIRSNDPHTPITLITEETPPFYYRPMLPYIIDGSKKVEDIVMTMDPATTFAIELVQGSVQAVTAASKTVRLSTGKTLHYDNLIIASGSSPVLPGLEGEEGKGVYTVRTLDDALKIRSAAETAKKAVVIGGGFVGVKASEALLRRGIKVSLVEQQQFILYPRVDAVASDILSGRLRSAGLEIINGERPVGIVRNRNTVKGVRLASRMIEADMVIIATGTKPNVDFLRASGIRCERGVITDEYLSTSVPGVYAAGDVIENRELVHGNRAVSALWSNAQEMGRIAGTNAAGGAIRYDGFLSVRNASDIHGLAVVSAGAVDEGQDGYEVFVHREGERYRKIVYDGERIIGALFIGDIREAGIFANLIKNRVIIEKDKARSILRGRINYNRLYAMTG